MILQALYQLYERLPDIDQPGFAPMGLSWAVVISPDGDLQCLFPLRQQAERGNKLVPTSHSVPSPGKRTSGDKEGFVADKTDYLFGFDPSAANDPKAKEKLKKRFELFRDAHLSARPKINHPDFDAMCLFLEKWNPEDPDVSEKLATAANAQIDEIIGSNLTFQVSGKTSFVHQIQEVRKYWSKISSEEKDATIGLCLITGEEQPLARLHDPAIKGVVGAQSSGATLVSFNAKAYESYGKEQSYNAPVGSIPAFAYCTALNWLTGQKDRRFRIGDVTAVFWTAEPTPAEALFPQMMSGVPDAEDDVTKQRIGDILEKISRGTLGSDELGAPDTDFYILGLSPNASRLSVRFWHTGTLRDLIANLKLHLNQLEIVRQWDETNSKNPEPLHPSSYQLLRQTARDADGIPPLLGGALMRSILLGTDYPSSFITAVHNRIRAERDVTYLKAAILRAWLIRNHNQTITTMLDETNTNPGYRLGRLFAVLEKAQQDALPGINSTIRDRFYASASATPRAVFGRLLRTYQHHLGKLDEKLKSYREKQTQEILSSLGDFPAHLNLQNQSQFALGYYHQRKDFFTKKDTPQPTETATV
ncbi:MAG: type I-C CRISPR-associated protein Cas8c/Csd1 [Verrucomicrobiae bacterium]|nr:type I-C CRISPR-associated protein Cas8c/Csd1 [Verrucomicrobiae bacterium]